MKLFSSVNKKRRVQCSWYTQLLTNILDTLEAMVSSGGPIYGELTKGDVQKIVDFLTVNCNLTDVSRFIDTGNGRGKPSMHVVQDPGVQFSFGIEIEKLRNNLGGYSVYLLLSVAMQDDAIGCRCLFEHGNISEAKIT